MHLYVKDNLEVFEIFKNFACVRDSGPLISLASLSCMSHSTRVLSK